MCGGGEGGGAYLIFLNIALFLSFIDLVVKNEGGGEGLNNFLLLKKGGLCLLKRGIIERVPLRWIYGKNTKHITCAVIHHPATLATYWGGLIPASSSANFTFDFPPFNFACATVSCSNY